jgi:hypothetical protein
MSQTVDKAAACSFAAAASAACSSHSTTSLHAAPVHKTANAADDAAAAVSVSTTRQNQRHVLVDRALDRIQICFTQPTICQPSTAPGTAVHIKPVAAAAAAAV